MTTDQAIGVLRSRWADFVALERDILDLQHRAAVASGAARRSGDTLGAEAAKEVIRRLGDLAQLHLTIVEKVEGLAAQFPGLLEQTPPAGLGALPLIPVWAVATLVGAAGGMLLFFNRMSAESAALDAIESAIGGVAAGTLSPEQAGELFAQARALIEAEEDARPPSPLGQTAADLAKVAAVGVALWLLVTRAGGGGVRW